MNICQYLSKNTQIQGKIEFHLKFYATEMAVENVQGVKSDLITSTEFNNGFEVFRKSENSELVMCWPKSTYHCEYCIELQATGQRALCAVCTFRPKHSQQNEFALYLTNSIIIHIIKWMHASNKYVIILSETEKLICIYVCVDVTPSIPVF